MDAVNWAASAPRKTFATPKSVRTTGKWRFHLRILGGNWCGSSIARLYSLGGLASTKRRFRMMPGGVRAPNRRASAASPPAVAMFRSPNTGLTQAPRTYVRAARDTAVPIALRVSRRDGTFVSASATPLPNSRNGSTNPISPAVTHSHHDRGLSTPLGSDWWVRITRNMTHMRYRGTIARTAARTDATIRVAPMLSCGGWFPSIPNKTIPDGRTCNPGRRASAPQASNCSRYPGFRTAISP